MRIAGLDPFSAVCASWDSSETAVLRQGAHVAVVPNRWYHFGLGAPPLLIYFSGDWDVHWGYSLLSHSHFAAKHFLNRVPFPATPPAYPQRSRSRPPPASPREPLESETDAVMPLGSTRAVALFRSFLDPAAKTARLSSPAWTAMAIAGSSGDSGR